MPDDLYERDVLAWAEHQAALLRRVARGERVDEVDWNHVVEEIEDVGQSELNAVHGHGWPDLESDQHWRAEIDAFQTGLERRFTPSMRQRIDLANIHARAIRQIRPTRHAGKAALEPPETCPVTLDQLPTLPVEDLEAAVASSSTG